MVKIIGCPTKFDEYGESIRDLVERAFDTCKYAHHQFIFGSFYPDGRCLLTKNWICEYRDEASGWEEWTDGEHIITRNFNAH